MADGESGSRPDARRFRPWHVALAALAVVLVALGAWLYSRSAGDQPLAAADASGAPPVRVEDLSGIGSEWRQDETVAGSTELVTRDGENVTVAGWAADKTFPEKTVSVAVFSPDAYVGGARPTAPRQDVSDAIGVPAATLAAFEVNGVKGCVAGQPYTVLVLTDDKRYRQISAPGLTCP